MYVCSLQSKLKTTWQERSPCTIKTNDNKNSFNTSIRLIHSKRSILGSDHHIQRYHNTVETNNL